MKFEHTSVDDDRVPCVHPSLISHHHIGGAAQEIGDFSFSFVTPLSADDDNIGQGYGGPKPQICTIREYFRSGVPKSKVVVFCGVTVISTLSIVASPHSSSMVTVYVVVVLGERVGFGIFTSLTPVLGLQV